MLDIDPNEDGITHINVYSQAKTELGRFLSNFAHSPVNTPDGHFESLEGYWYWLKTYDDYLRELYGYKAKEYGKKLPVVNQTINKSKFKKALYQKVKNNSEWLKQNPLWNDLSLPLKHYYVYGGKPKEAGGQWVLDILEQLRFDMID
jgi:hypothetical protein